MADTLSPNLKATTEPAAAQQVTYSVVIPTLNGGAALWTLLASLERQDPAPESIVLIDSGSTDGSLARDRLGRALLYPVIGRFNHGAARNQGFDHCRTDVIVFMTQDAVPQEGAISRLIAPLVQGQAAAAFSRQVARTDANPLEQFARLHNYPAQGRLISGPIGGVHGVVLSNVCSAIRREPFEEVGRFPTHTIMNEDMLFAARLLKAGHHIEYVADATVVHSHEYRLPETFRRYFDIGVVMAQAGDELAEMKLGRQGLVYVEHLISWLWRQGHYSWVLKALVESAAKWSGTRLGLRHDRLPPRLRQRLSMHANYWEH